MNKVIYVYHFSCIKHSTCVWIITFSLFLFQLYWNIIQVPHNSPSDCTTITPTNFRTFSSLSPQKTPYLPLSSHLLFFPNTPCLGNYSIQQPILDISHKFHVNRISRYVFCCDWLCSLSSVFSSFIHIVACVIIIPFYCSVIIHCTYHILTMHHLMGIWLSPLLGYYE